MKLSDQELRSMVAYLKNPRRPWNKGEKATDGDVRKWASDWQAIFDLE